MPPSEQPSMLKNKREISASYPGETGSWPQQIHHLSQPSTFRTNVCNISWASFLSPIERWKFPFAKKASSASVLMGTDTVIDRLAALSTFVSLLLSLSGKVHVRKKCIWLQNMRCTCMFTENFFSFLCRKFEFCSCFYYIHTVLFKKNYKKILEIFDLHCTLNWTCKAKTLGCWV